MMPSPTNLHHMQQILQQHVLSPTQLQNLMKQQSLLQQQHQVGYRFAFSRFSTLSLLVFENFCPMKKLQRYSLCNMLLNFNTTKIQQFEHFLLYHLFKKYK